MSNDAESALKSNANSIRVCLYVRACVNIHPHTHGDVR